MSFRLWKFLLQDIIDATVRIQSYVQGRSFDEFCHDRILLDAVERNFITIGEAASQVPVVVRDRFSHVPWREMADMRNLLVHRYWRIEPLRVWETICNDLPPLVPMLSSLIETASE